MRLRTTAMVTLAGGAMLALTLSGCGSGGETNTGRATAVPGVPDGAAYVDQDNLKFSPKTLTVSSGETVYFKNSESALHTVSINGKNESGPMKRDQVFTWTAPAPGEYKVSCEFHPQMKATLTVQ